VSRANRSKKEELEFGSKPYAIEQRQEHHVQ